MPDASRPLRTEQDLAAATTITLAREQREALSSLLVNAIMDTGSNRLAALYRTILTEASQLIPSTIEITDEMALAGARKLASTLGMDWLTNHFSRERMDCFPMPKFTIETTYRTPYYRHRTYDAPTAEEAWRRAVDDDDNEGELPDYETTGDTYVTGIWIGEDAAYKGAALPVSSEFYERVQRKAEHFDALATLLTEAAQAMGLSRVDFALWLPRAQAALAKADAIRAGAPDPAPAPPSPDLDAETGEKNKMKNV